MTRRRGSLCLAVWLAWASPVFATQPGRCRLIAEATTQTTIETQPARVCTVQFIATSANGWARVYDPLPNDKTIAEPGAATQFNNGQSIDFGEEGFVTEFGLAATVVNGRVIIRYGR